jgi:hypothetical protein
MTAQEQQKLMWFSAVAVLRCPMAVEDKIATLEGMLKPLIEESGLPSIPPTGLQPFDTAISSYFRHVTQEP